MRNHIVSLALAAICATGCKDSNVTLPQTVDTAECTLWALKDFPKDYETVTLADAKRLAARLRGCSVLHIDAGAR